MTVRQVFYQLVVRGVIEKTEEQYQGTVIRLLTDLRMAGSIPFNWIVDESRRRIVNRTYNGIADAARDTARFYRRSALHECPDYVEIWSNLSVRSAPCLKKSPGFLKRTGQLDRARPLKSPVSRRSILTS